MIGKTSMRLFSTTAIKHTPPKKLHGIPGRYAEAVYVAASKIGALDKVEGELLAVQESLRKSPSFAAYLWNPTVSRKDKYIKVGELFDETKFSHITRNLFLTLSANGRLADTHKVIGSYEELIQAAKGIVKAVVISSEPLKKKSFDAVKEAIVKIVGSGKTVEVSEQVDEKILGGLQVLVGDKFIDLSVASRVNTLTKTLDSSA